MAVSLEEVQGKGILGAGRAQSTFRRKGVRFRSRAEAKAED